MLLAEAVWLWRRGRGRPVEIVLALAPAALILLGVRAALTGTAWPFVAAPLLLAWPVHLADLRRRRW